jgi:hypothetical protein
MAEMEENPLVLRHGDAHKIRVEEPNAMLSSFFVDSYRHALSCLQYIDVDNRRLYWEEMVADGKIANEEKDDGRYLPEFNNVIAFCGERGSGKTSAMISFRNLLRDWQQSKSKILNLVDRDFDKPLRFLCIDPVDPSRFEPNDRLVGSILAELYRRYLQLSQDRTEVGDFERRKNLEVAFSNALKSIQMLDPKSESPFGKPGEGENEFEILRRAAEAASMRDNFHKLIQAFLNYKFATDKKASNHYLVIPVDDLDMSIRHAYQLAEDIRKYLMVPNVIILIAMKLDQLRMAVEQENYDRFRVYKEIAKMPKDDEVETMSNLYLEKLIPLNRRVMMPDLLNDGISIGRKVEYHSKHSDNFSS